MRFEPVCEAERDAIDRLFTDPEVMRHYAAFVSPLAGTNWLRAIAHMRSARGFAPWTVKLHDGTFVGQVGPFAQTIDGRPEVELICFFFRAFWRSGYAAEASRACVAHAFASDARLARMVALIRPENRPSRFLALRCGFAFERRAIHDGMAMDVFAIDRFDGAHEPDYE